MDSQPTSATPSGRPRLHPLIAAAAAAVLVASLAAVAAITGVLPGANSSNAPPQPVVAEQAAPAPAVPDTTAEQQAAPAEPPVAAVAPPAPAAPPQPVVQAAPPVAAYVPPPVCNACGTVESVRTVRVQGHGTGIGAVGGAVAGGLIGNQFGGGGGRTAITVLGALGGGLAGNSVERNLRSSTYYAVRVRMQNGHYRTFNYREPPPFAQGQPVRIANGTLAAG